MADTRPSDEETYFDWDDIPTALRQVLEFVSTDPCFKLLGSVTQDEVLGAIRRSGGSHD